MFKIVTNFDHWHSVFESRDCTEEFRRAAIGTVRGSTFPWVALTSRPEGIGDREYVVALVAESANQLWSLEAIIRVRLKEKLDDVLSPDNTARRSALAVLMGVARELDSVSGEPSRSERKGETEGRKLLGKAVVAIGLLVFVGIAVSLIRGGKDVVAQAESATEQVKEAVDQASGMLAETKDLAGAMTEILKESKSVLAETATIRDGVVKAASDGMVILNSVRTLEASARASAKGAGGSLHSTQEVESESRGQMEEYLSQGEEVKGRVEEMLRDAERLRVRMEDVELTLMNALGKGDQVLRDSRRVSEKLDLALDYVDSVRLKTQQVEERIDAALEEGEKARAEAKSTSEELSGALEQGEEILRRTERVGEEVEAAVEKAAGFLEIMREVNELVMRGLQGSGSDSGAEGEGDVVGDEGKGGSEGVTTESVVEGEGREQSDSGGKGGVAESHELAEKGESPAVESQDTVVENGDPEEDDAPAEAVLDDANVGLGDGDDVEKRPRVFEEGRCVDQGPQFVESLQRHLMIEGYKLQDGADGRWGPETRSAFRWWSKESGMCEELEGEFTADDAYGCVCRVLNEPIEGE